MVTWVRKWTVAFADGVWLLFRDEVAVGRRGSWANTAGSTKARCKFP